MTGIIAFPGSNNLKSQTPDVIHDKIITGPWTITCSKCNAKLNFKTETMIFRRVEFYCGSCNTFSVVTNPAFSTK